MKVVHLADNTTEWSGIPARDLTVAMLKMAERENIFIQTYCFPTFEKDIAVS